MKFGDLSTFLTMSASTSGAATTAGNDKQEDKAGELESLDSVSGSRGKEMMQERELARVREENEVLGAKLEELGWRQHMSDSMTSKKNAVRDENMDLLGGDDNERARKVPGETRKKGGKKDEKNGKKDKREKKKSKKSKKKKKKEVVSEQVCECVLFVCLFVVYFVPLTA